MWLNGQQRDYDTMRGSQSVSSDLFGTFRGRRRSGYRGGTGGTFVTGVEVGLAVSLQVAGDVGGAQHLPADAAGHFAFVSDHVWTESVFGGKSRGAGLQRGKKEKEKRMRTLRRKRSAEECSEGERRVSGLTVTWHLNGLSEEWTCFTWQLRWSGLRRRETEQSSSGQVNTLRIKRFLYTLPVQRRGGIWMCSVCSDNEGERGGGVGVRGSKSQSMAVNSSWSIGHELVWPSFASHSDGKLVCFPLVFFWGRDDGLIFKRQL